MNIFVLDLNPRTAATYHCDIHVGKMAMEASQLLSVAHHRYNPNADKIRGLCVPTHVNHPCAIWARGCKENYEWLLELYVGLHEEYMYRFGTMHGNFMRYSAIRNTPPLLPKYDTMTSFALAMPNQHKCEDAVLSYRNYYREGKQHLLKYTKRDRPKWIKK